VKKIVTFGEIMLRLNPPGFLRFGQARSFDIAFGGGEANVSASLANFGLATDFVTRLPKNDLGEACLAYLRSFGIGTPKIIRGGKRIGIYFLENGAVQRGSKVVYDRDGSAIAEIKKGMVDWIPYSPMPTGSTGPGSRRRSASRSARSVSRGF